MEFLLILNFMRVGCYCFNNKCICSVESRDVLIITPIYLSFDFKVIGELCM